MLSQIFANTVTADGIAEDVLEQHITQQIESKLLMAAKFKDNPLNSIPIIISEDAQLEMWEKATLFAAEVKYVMEHGFLMFDCHTKMSTDGVKRYQMRTISYAADKALNALKAFFGDTLTDL